MNHTTASTLLDRFLDCELDAETRWAMAAHLAECSDCQVYVGGQARMRSMVRGRLGRMVAPHRVVSRIRAEVEGTRPAPAGERRFDLGRLSLFAAATVAVLILIFPMWLLRPPGARPGLAGELAAPHLLFAQDETLLEVTGSADNIQAWFRDRVSFPVVTPPVPGFDLAGGRLINVEGRRAALVVYERESPTRYVSLVYFDPQTPDSGDLTPSDSFKVGEYGRATVVTWMGRGERIALVGELPAQDMLRLAGQVAPAAGMQ